MFTKGFDSYVCDGDSITCTVDGFDCTATIHRDDDSTPPWKRDEWSYVGVAVTVSKNGIQLTGDFSHAIWGTEANYLDGGNAHLTALANEELDEALDAARAAIASLTV